MTTPSEKALTIRQALQLKGVPFVLITFWSYCALESTTGIWASSYLVQHRNINAETAAMFASLFYLGSTFMPPVFGLLAAHVSVGLYPVYLLLFGVLMLFMSERLRRKRG